MYYMQAAVDVSSYWHTVVTQTTTDRNGNFSVRLPPGRYLIHVLGQAGRKQAQWLGEVHVLWRSETRLSTPICSYDVE